MKIKLPNRPVGPFPAILVGAKVAGKPNYATVGACGVVNLKPILSVSLKSTHWTTKGVKESGYFSVNVPNTSLIEKVDFCGYYSGRDTDKSEVFTTFYDENGIVPMIEECSINFKCEVCRTIEVDDFELFLGEIKAVYANDNCLKDGKLSPSEVDPIVLLDTNYLSIDRAIGTIFKSGRKK
jgi:flavin reductase (DIM6/NTAB) family NADH-FMN oxidoreductase RutF